MISTYSNCKLQQSWLASNNISCFPTVPRSISVGTLTNRTADIEAAKIPKLNIQGLFINLTLQVCEHFLVCACVISAAGISTKWNHLPNLHSPADGFNRDVFWKANFLEKQHPVANQKSWFNVSSFLFMGISEALRVHCLN